MSLKKQVLEILSANGWMGYPYFETSDQAFDWACKKAADPVTSGAEPSASIIAGLLMTYAQDMQRADEKLGDAASEFQATASISAMLNEVGEELVKVKGEIEDFRTTTYADFENPAIDKLDQIVDRLTEILSKFHTDYVPEPDE